MVVRSSPWTSQPPVGTGVNQKWVNRGMVAMFDCRQARELISGDFATNRTSLLVPTSSGMADDFSGTANQQYAHRNAYAVTGDISIVVNCEIDSLTNYTHFISKQATTTTQAPYEFRLGASVSTDGKMYLLRANTLYQVKYSATDKVSAEYKGMLAVTSRGTINQISDGWVGGVKHSLSVAVGTATGTATDSGTSSVWVGQRFDGITQLDGRIYYVAVFKGVLSDTELLYLNNNKWDLYASRQRTVFYAATTTGPTIVDLAVAAFNTTAESPQLALNNTQDVTALNTVAESPQITLVNNQTAATFNFVAQNIEVITPTASIILDAATFGFVANDTQNTSHAILSTPTFDFVQNDAQLLIAHNLSVATFDFVQNDAQFAVGVLLSVTTFNFTANSITFPGLPSTGLATGLMLMGVGN